MVRKSKGWYGEHRRHVLAGMGISTSRKSKPSTTYSKGLPRDEQKKVDAWINKVFGGDEEPDEEVIKEKTRTIRDIQAFDEKGSLKKGHFNKYTGDEISEELYNSLKSKTKEKYVDSKEKIEGMYREKPRYEPIVVKKVDDYYEFTESEKVPSGELEEKADLSVGERPKRVKKTSTKKLIKKMKGKPKKLSLQDMYKEMEVK